MDGAHEPLRAIGADGNQGEADFRKAGADFGEMRAVGGVAGEEDRAGGRFDGVAAPESFIAITQSPAGKMVGGDGGDADGFREFGWLPPIEFGDLGIDGDFFVEEAAGDAERDGEIWFPLGGEAAERGDVEMIVVVVALEDEIDFRKVVERNAGGAMALGAGEGNGAGALGPDGIAENIDAVHLEEDGGVADEGGADGAAGDAVGWDGAGGGIDPFAPGAGLAMCEPFQKAAGAERTAVGRVEEMFAVEMVGGRAAVEFHSK